MEAQPTILVLTMPFGGHLGPLSPVLRALAESGIRVVVGSDCDLIEDPSVRGLEVAPFSTGLEPSTWGQVSYDVILDRILSTVRNVALGLPKLLAEYRPTALLVDQMMWGACGAAERSGLPWATFAHTPALYPTRSRFRVGREPSTLRGLLDGGAGFLWGYYKLHAAVLLRLNRLRIQSGLRPVWGFHQLGRRAEAVLAFTMPPFEYPRDDWGPNVRFVGPMVRPKEVERPSFIPSDKRVVLVSGSTAYQPGQERILRTTLAAFASDPEVFVIGTDPSGMVQCETPHAIVRPFLPHEDILPFASHVVCHAGAGLVHRALNFGVPLVVIPLGRDQSEVAARVRNAGVGCVVSSEALDEETLRRALKESDACRGRAQSMAKSFAAARGADVALETLRALVAKRPS